MKKTVSLLLAVLLALSLLTPALAAEGEKAPAAGAPLPFSDVASGAWYEDAVRFVWDGGLMTGTAPDAFSPDTTLTRAQLVTILWRMAGSPAADGGEAWYAQAMAWAAAEGLLPAGADPEGVLPREETALLLWNYARSIGTDVSAGEDTNILSFSDAFDITEGMAAALQWAVGAGILNGTGDGRLSPQDPLTRAQAAAILMRFAGAPASALSLWTDTAPLKQQLLPFLEAVTREGGPDYIPPEARIAVFDLDGTLCCETDPVYFDHCLLRYRVLEDPDYKDKATDFERQVAEKVDSFAATGVYPAGMDMDHGRAVASAFAGMTVAEFEAYVKAFKARPCLSYSGMTLGETFYRPMVQVVDLLQANGFTVYIVSGTDRFIVRGLVEDSILHIPRQQIIGSDEAVVASGQGKTDGLDYVFSQGEKVVLGGDFLIKNLKMNKVSVIMQEIGRQPVLAFGNSTGDSSMLNFAISENPFRSLSFMLCCDDLERENGTLAKADKARALCEQNGWVPVSMRDDWTTIYGPGVTYLGASLSEEAA